MTLLHRFLAVASAAFFIAGSAQAQIPGEVTNHAFLIGKGAGVTGYTSLLCGSAQLAVGQAAADPICRTITGDVTITAAGATAIGTAKVTTAMMALLSVDSTILAANAVTNAKLATMPAFTFKGNNTSGAATPADVDIAALTTKSPAASDYVMISDQAAAGAWKKALVSSFGGAGSVSSVNGQTGALVMWAYPQGRLTLTTGTAVMASSVSAATTIYYTSTGVGGKNVPIYNGSAVGVYQICAANTAGACELSVVLGANWTTNSNYDWFVGLNGGSPTLCSGPAWTSDTARGTGAGTTELQSLDGLQTNKNSMTCRTANATTITCAVNQCTYVGSNRIGTAGQANYVLGGSGTPCLLGVWNMYNRRSVATSVVDATASWNYTTASFRQKNNSAINQCQMIRGFDEDAVIAEVDNLYSNSTASIVGVCGIGIDSTTVNSAQGFVSGANASNNVAAGHCTYTGYPGIGWHNITAEEYSQAGGVGTFFGTNAFGTSSLSVRLAN